VVVVRIGGELDEFSRRSRGIVGGACRLELLKGYSKSSSQRLLWYEMRRESDATPSAHWVAFSMIASGLHSQGNASFKLIHRVRQCILYIMQLSARRLNHPWRTCKYDLLS